MARWQFLSIWCFLSLSLCSVDGFHRFNSLARNYNSHLLSARGSSISGSGSGGFGGFGGGEMGLDRQV